VPIDYDGGTFLPGVPLTVDDKFNTYRFTDLVPIFTDALQEGWDVRLGATLAIRDAQIKLSQGALVRDFSNVGPIPLLYMSAAKKWNGGWRVLGEFDASPCPWRRWPVRRIADAGLRDFARRRVECRCPTSGRGGEGPGNLYLVVRVGPGLRHSLELLMGEHPLGLPGP
jgi:hypothetical protein